MDLVKIKYLILKNILEASYNVENLPKFFFRDICLYE